MAKKLSKGAKMQNNYLAIEHNERLEVLNMALNGIVEALLKYAKNIENAEAKDGHWRTCDQLMTLSEMMHDEVARQKRVLSE